MFSIELGETRVAILLCIYVGPLKVDVELENFDDAFRRIIVYSMFHS